MALEPGSHPGSPGATIYRPRFDSGMQLVVAIYPPQGQARYRPVMAQSGLAVPISFMHHFAEHLSSRGAPVALVQVPGLGAGALYAGNRDEPDGFEYTMQAMAFDLGPQTVDLLHQLFQEKLVVAGASRGAYITRLMKTGLVRGPEGRLLHTAEATRLQKEAIAGYVPLFGPLEINDLIRRAVEGAPAFVHNGNRYHKVWAGLSRRLPGAWLKEALAVLEAEVASVLLRRVDAMKVVWGDNPDPAIVRHALRYGRSETLPRAAHQEILNLITDVGWTANDDTNLLRAYAAACRDPGSPPVHVFHASKDGGDPKRELRHGVELTEVDGYHAEMFFERGKIRHLVDALLKLPMAQLSQKHP